MLVGGEAGAGKTRLASEFARRCHADGAIVLCGGCDRDLAVPYQPWVAVVEQLAALADAPLVAELAGELDQLVVLAPHLEGRVHRAKGVASADPETERQAVFHAMVTVLGRLASTTDVVVVLDDLHWAGSQTLALLRHVARSAQGSGMLVVGLFRDTGDEITEPLSSTLADLRRSGSVSRLKIGGLDDAAVRDLLIEAGAGTAADNPDSLDSLAAAVIARTGGNPFYVAELCRNLAASDARVDDLCAIVPDSIREVVGERLARLSSAARQLAQVAAVAGNQVDLPALVGAAELSTAAAHAGLDELVAAGLVLETSEPSFRLSHALLGDTIADSMSVVARARVHLRLAEALERIHVADRRPVLVDLARHFRAAAPLGGGAKAVYYARRAAAQARRAAAYDEAIGHLPRR